MAMAQLGNTETTEALPPQLPQTVEKLGGFSEVFLVFGNNEFATLVDLESKGVTPDGSSPDVHIVCVTQELSLVVYRA